MTRRTRRTAIGAILAFLFTGFLSAIIVIVDVLRAWPREVAPFKAIGARVSPRREGDPSPIADAEDVARIVFPESASDADLARLVPRMARFPNLELLVLQGPRVTDAGLMSLRNLRQLKTIRLYDTRVTPAGRRSFREALPDVKVY